MKEEDAFEEFSDEEITNILKEALTVKIKEKKKIPNKVQLNKALVGTVGEFLSCFKLMGYDLDGNPVNLTVYKEKIEKSALDNLFMQQMSVFMESRMN